MKKCIFRISFVASFVILMGLTESDAASNYLTVSSSPIFDVEIEFETVYPKENQYLLNEVLLEWNINEGASSYQLQIASEVSFSNLVVDISNLESNSYSTSLTLGGMYYWRVFAINNGIAIDTTNSSQFIIFNPKQIDSLSIWLTGDSVSVSVLNRVSFWYDLSDSLNGLTQGNAARQPDFIPNFINGYGVVDFPDSRPSVFTGIRNVPGKNYYVSSVYNWHGAVGVPTRFINSQTSGNLWRLGPNTSHSLRQQSGMVGVGLPVEQDRFVLNTAYAAGDSVANIINGIRIGKALTSRAPEMLRIGIGGGEIMNGAVAEIIVYSGLISKNDQENLDHYLMDKYAPPINLGADRVVCNLPDSIILVNDYIVNYSWNTGDTTPNLRFDTSGLYILSATDIFGRVFSDSILIIQDSVDFVVDFNADTIIGCEGQLVTLTSNLSKTRFSYLWSIGDTTPRIIVNQDGNYKLTVKNCLGNFSSDSVQVIFTNPLFSLGADTSGCHNNFVQLAPDSNFTNVNYLWSSGENTANVLADTSGKYTLTITDQYGCSYSDSIIISIDSSLLGLTLGPDTTLCGGNSLGLLNPAVGISSYQWSNGSNMAVLQVDTSGVYTVIIGNGQCVVSDTIDIFIKGLSPNVGYSAGKFCQNEPVQFTDTTRDPNNITINSYKWFFGDGDSSSIKDPSHKFDSANTYTVSLEVMNDSGCVGRFSSTIQINSKPANNFNVGVSCKDDTTRFINTSVVNSGIITRYFWDFGVQALLGDTSIITNPSYIYSADSNFLVHLISQSSDECIDTITKSIKINSKPSASFTFSSVVFGNNVKFVNTSSIDSGQIIFNQWNFGNGNVSSQLNPSQAYGGLGKYYVSLTVQSDSSCGDSFIDSITIIPPSPKFNTIHPKAGQTVNGKVEFVWNEKDTASFYRIQVASDSSFISVVHDSTNLNLNSIPFNFNSITDFYWRVFAYRNTAIIDTTNIGRFSNFNPLEMDSLTLWLNGDSVLLGANNKVVSWFDYSDSARVLTQNNPANQPTFIQDQLNGFSALDFNAATGNNFFLNAVDINNPRYYISSVYNFHESVGRFCSFINSSLLGNRWVLGPYFKHRLFQGSNFIGDGFDIVQDQFVINTAFAEGDSISSIINGVSTGKELSGNLPRDLRIGINNNERMNGVVAEILMIEGVVSPSLQSKLDKYLMDKYAPPVNLGKDRVQCVFPDSLSFMKDYIVDYRWNTGDSVASIEIDSAGLYVLEATDIFGRMSIDSLFFIKDTLDVGFSFNQDTLNFCFGDTISLATSFERFSYQWSTGDTISTIELSTTARYTVTVKNCIGVVLNDSIQVNFNSPSFDLGADTTICHNGIIVIQPDSIFSNVNYLWSTGELSNSILVDTTNSYYLTVKDQYFCSFSDTIRISIDSSLFGLTLGKDTTLCEGNLIQLINPNPSISSYFWSTGSINSTSLVDTAGSYKVIISNGRCQVSDTINVAIKGKAPIANFEFQNLCFGDSLSFVDSSKVAVINDTIINWNWHFGNGDRLVLQNPRYRYAQKGRYSVFLEIETDKGCFDSISKLVEINPLPTANFNFQQSIVCAKSRIFHQDSSSISGGLISDYDWNFGDTLSNQNTSTAKNPFHTFDTVGNYNILLKVTSNLGCFDSVQKTLFVNSSPIPNYTIDGFCIGDSITLSEQVAYAGPDSIEYFWTIRALGGNFTTDRRMNPKLKFTNAGNYDIGLRARNTIGIFEWCEANFKDTITLFDSPMADFIIPEICENDSFEISNFSMPVADILKYRYILNQTDTFNLPNPKINGKLPGKYSLGLLISDVNSCKDSIVKQLEISQKPKIQFAILNNNSGVPFNIDLENRSLSSSSYLWKFGTGDTSPDEQPNYVYSDTGTFQITLIGSNPSGCIDSTSQDASALSKFIDASLTKLFLTENTLGDIEVSFQILNSGFNTINNLLMSVDLNNEFEFRQLFSTNLYSGRSDGFKMDATFIPNAGRKIDYVCVRIFAVNGESDSIVLNNELCELGFNDELSITLYPNPVEDLLNFQYTLPDDGVAQIQFFDALGRERKNGFSKQQEEGFYSTVFNLVDFTRGIYYYRFIFNGNVKTGKFMVK